MAEDLPERAPLAEAFQRYHAADWQGAAESCRKLVEHYPYSAPGWHLWGLAELRLGDPASALQRMEHAISLDSTKAHFFNHSGAALEALGRPSEALARFQRAAELNPQYTEAHANCGAIYERLLQHALAESALRRACACAPKRTDLLCRWARMLVATGRREEAFRELRSAATVVPSDRQAELYAQLGDLYLEADDVPGAIDAYQAALRTDPAMADVWFHLGQAYGQQGKVHDAGDAFTNAMQLRPDMTPWQLQKKLLSPGVFASTAEIDRFQAQLLTELSDPSLDAARWTFREILAAGIYPPFPLNFQGRQTRAIKERLATLVRGNEPRPRPSARHGKPRVGFVVTSGHEGLFLRCTGGIVERLDRDAFDVSVIASATCLPLLKKRLSSAITFVALPSQYDQAAEILQQAACDLLYHWEVGSDAINYLLPLVRAAAVQCTSWGTQVTSGLAEVDYYLSSQWIERSDADADYTETLVRLENLPTWQRRVTPPPITDKGYFGWSERQHIYLCPQNLLKIHPDQDALFARILDADADALVVLKQTRSAEIVRQLQARFERTLGPLAQRVVWLPWLSVEDYYRLIAVADVVLDPVHYSAGSSCYDMLSLDQPIVTLPGALNVGRFTQACYRSIGFSELIADSKETYVQLALRIAQDEAYRRHVREELKSRNGELFEDDRAVAAHAAFFRDAISQSP